MNQIKAYTNQLRSRGYRLTPQRLTILRVLAEAGTHLTPIQVIERARGELPGLTEPTVYRTLSFLAEEGLTWVSQLGDGQVAYEIAEHDHHHLVCRKCGRWLQIDHDMVESLYQELHARTGYQIETRHLTLSGLCPDCQETGAGS